MRYLPFGNMPFSVGSKQLPRCKVSFWRKAKQSEGETVPTVTFGEEMGTVYEEGTGLTFSCAG